MHENLKKVPEHLMNLGVGMLSQAQKNALYTGRGSYLDEGAFAVLQAAQSAEMLIKSAIAKEHPLLIISKVPTSGSVNGELLSIEHIFEKGETIKYSDLPEKLWAATGYKLQNQNDFKCFGKLRNTIQHFAVPSDRDLRCETIQFIYKVIDPLLGHFWNMTALNFFDIADCPMDDLEEKLFNYGVDVQRDGFKITK
ncbi:TPA: hypothetical protein NJ357_004477 [Vibrio parahaemolyticus]|nr:hypothetical protein [Vibrio parahaemolyticus]